MEGVFEARDVFGLREETYSEFVDEKWWMWGAGWWHGVAVPLFWFGTVEVL